MMINKMMINKLCLGLSLALVAVAACGDGGNGGAGSSDVVINEVFVKSSLKGNHDWVELFNKGDATVDLSGWMLRDAKDRDPFVFADTALGGGAFLVVEQDPTGVEGFTFGLGRADAVRLFDPSGTLVDRTSWDDNSVLLDKSLGRIPDGTGDFVILSTPTKGTANEQ